MLSFTAMVWIGFLLLIALIVALDLGVFHRHKHVVTLPEALGWTAVWFSVALAFNVGVYYLYELNPSGWDMDTEQLTGREAAVQFLTGYFVEKSLSVDNIFVIAGVQLLERFDWIVYVFGGLLLFSAASMLVTRHDNLAPENNSVIRLVRRIYPVTEQYRIDECRA